MAKVSLLAGIAAALTAMQALAAQRQQNALRAQMRGQVESAELVRELEKANAEILRLRAKVQSEGEQSA